MRPTNILTSLALCATVAHAWPFHWDLLGTEQAARIRARQNDNSGGSDTSTQFDLSLSLEQGNTATTESSNSDENTSSARSSGRQSSGDNSDSNTSSGGSSERSSGKSTKTSNTSQKTFDPRLPAGGIQMVTPNPMAGAKYYKIADYVTFGFNFTSLSITPSAIDILATCTLNSATYTIATNQSVSTGTDAVQAVTWDTGGYQSTASVPLLLGTYTLMVYDAANTGGPPTAAAQAGYLGLWDQFTFGMYTPQPYVPLADYTCATCSGAAGLEGLTFKFIGVTLVATVLGAGWFAGVAGLW